eukprot:TRINITY_DN26856_c0_g1_i1.p1 TRINITY_DN26856_c0_g1~~TRINITY_DN26856_c0_g1_i1.p1  ORF type:complete len:248 (-),score=20.62 TRINITY_DN26856_c0_g1_i1:272-973(-)
MLLINQNKSFQIRCRLVKQIQVQSNKVEFKLPKYFGIDVEFSHFYIKQQKEQLIVPGHVCLVDQSGIIYENYINPNLSISLDRIGHQGGVQLSETEKAPTIEQVRKDVQNIIDGHVLVGHSLDKDMEALGLVHPPELCRDTMSYKKFKNRGGGARSLQHLASKHLRCEIQLGRHNPCEDAQTSLNLYLDKILPYNSQLSELEMKEKFLKEIMEEVNRRQQEDSVEMSSNWENE